MVGTLFSIPVANMNVVMIDLPRDERSTQRDWIGAARHRLKSQSIRPPEVFDVRHHEAGMPAS
jgi:hypothetical protein